MAGFKNKTAKKGFDRPQATAGVVVDREWKDVFPQDLCEGDIVVGLGAVTSIIPFPDCRDQIWLEAGIPVSKEYFLDNDVFVKAFVRKDN